MIVANMQAALRDDLYYERNKNACNEMDTYELKEDGTFGAADKCHDDLVMTRAIGLFVSSKMPVPEEVSEKKRSSGKKKWLVIQVCKIMGMSLYNSMIKAIREQRSNPTPAELLMYAKLRFRNIEFVYIHGVLSEHSFFYCRLLYS